MTNVTIIFVFAMLAGISGISVILTMVQPGMRALGPSFRLLGTCVFGWLLSETVYFAGSNTAFVEYMFNMKIPFVAFAPVALLLHCLHFYHMERYITRRLCVLLCAIPVITTLLALTSPWHGLLRAELQLIQLEPVHLMHNVRGPWFWVHTAWCYLLTLTSAGIVFGRHGRLPSGFRAPSVVMILAIVCNLCANVFSLFSTMPMDLTALGMGISLILIYAASAASGQSDLLHVARDQIYNSVEDYIFIQDLAGNVADANKAARSWMQDLKVPLVFPFPFADIMTLLRKRGATVNPEEHPGEGMDIFYSENDRGVVYNVRERYVPDRKNRPIGIYSIWADVTRYRDVIERLQKTVEIDTLTGLASRKAFEDLKQRCQVNEVYPLSVILGDANGLKQVNDQLGHHQGDLLLRALAQQLRQSCPPAGTPARIGGDEFLLLLPGVEEGAANAIAAEIEAGLPARATEAFTPSIALGVATRRCGDDGLEDMDALVRRADQSMYAKKENDRRSRE